MKNTEQRISKAITLLNQGKNELAKLVCKKIVDDTPHHYQANLLLGVIALNTHNHDVAEKHLRISSSTATTRHDKAQALNNLSLSLSHQQRLTEALVSINEAIQLKQQPLFYCNRANIFERLSRWTEMQQDLVTVLSLSPDILEAYTSLAVAMRHLHDHTAALELLEQHSDIENQDWLNEWALLSGINHQLNNVRQHITATQLSDDAIIALGDYALEQNYSEIAHALYLIAQEHLNEHPILQHQLNALQGITSLQAPREYVESLFDSCAEQFEERLVTQLQYQLPEQIIEKLQTFIPDVPINATDLGCGTGLLGKALSRHASLTSLTGIDLSSQMLKQAEKSGLYHQLIHGDIIECLKPSADTDLILAADVLIYLGDLSSLFSHAFDALKQGGLFAFSTESCANIDIKNNDIKRNEASWLLATSGRYQHSADYIHSLTEKCNFTLLHRTECHLRLEKNQPVEGMIYILQKA